jgi:hypothetical protein
MSVRSVQPGQLWHWEHDATPKERSFIYTARDALYLQTLPVAVEDVQLNGRFDALLADLSGLFDGDDEKVEEALRRDKLRAIRIPYESLDRVELLPFLGETHLRIRYRQGDKPRKATLKRAAAGAGQFFEELREAISPSSSVVKTPMSLGAALQWPILAALWFMSCGGVFYMGATERFEDPRAILVLVEKVGRLVGPLPIIVVTALLVCIPIGIAVSRVRTRPTISVWSNEGAR